jgi:hypothetical protein
MVTVKREYLSPMSYRVLIIRAAATAYLSGISITGDTDPGKDLMGQYYKTVGIYGVTVPYNTEEVSVGVEVAEENAEAAVSYSVGTGSGTAVAVTNRKGIFTVDIRDIEPGAGRDLTIEVKHPYLSTMKYTITVVREIRYAYLSKIEIRDDSDSYGTERFTGTFNQRSPEYNVMIPETAAKVRVKPEVDAENLDAEVKAGTGTLTSESDGEWEFAVSGDMTVTVEVSRQYLRTMTYKINIVRVRPSVYYISVPADTAGKNGKVRVTAEISGQRVTVGNAMPEDTLRITVTPNLGYELEDLNPGGITIGTLGASHEDGEGGIYWDFTMPVNDVSFDPDYRAIPPMPGVLYVAERGRVKGSTIYDNDGNPDGVADGTSWGRAVTDLQWVIDTKFDGNTYTEIWVEGTVHPESWADDIEDSYRGDDRNKSFVLPANSGVKIYGGFGGTETGTDADDGRSKRLKDGDDFLYESVLSGEIDGGKVYHVVIAPGHTANHPELHDLTISGGQASLHGSIMVNEKVINGVYGGGLYGDGGVIVLENLRIYDNKAAESGGGAYFCGGVDPQMDTVDFLNNMSNLGGGAYYENNGGSVTTIWKDLRFLSNSGSDGGGLWYNSSGGTFILEGAVFKENFAANKGGGAFISSPVFISNHGEWSGNTAVLGGGGLYGGGYHLNSLFTANRALGMGGAIGSEDALTLVNTSVVKNSAAIFLVLTPVLAGAVLRNMPPPGIRALCGSITALFGEIPTQHHIQRATDMRMALMFIFTRWTPGLPLRIIKSLSETA